MSRATSFAVQQSAASSKMKRGGRGPISAAARSPGVTFKPETKHRTSSKKKSKRKEGPRRTTIEDLEDILQSCKIGIPDGDPYADFVDLNLINNQSAMMPSILVNWKDQDLRERLTLFVWVLSGLEPQDLHAKILTGGEKIRIQFPWPEQLQDAMQLTKYRYCRDASKVVEIETIVKNLKGGSASSPILSVVDFHLGMKVEEQFYSETIVTRYGRPKYERGNTVLKFLRRRVGRNEQIPVVIQKFEMMGIRDNYRSGAAVATDYEDGDSVVFVNGGRNDGGRESTEGGEDEYYEEEEEEEQQAGPSPPKKQKRISSKRKQNNSSTTSRRGRRPHSTTAAATTTTRRREEERKEDGRKKPEAAARKSENGHSITHPSGAGGGGGVPPQTLNRALGGFMSRIGATSSLKKTLEDTYVIPKNITTTTTTTPTNINCAPDGYYGGRAVIDDDDDDEDEYMRSIIRDEEEERSATDDEFDHDL